MAREDDSLPMSSWLYKTRHPREKDSLGGFEKKTDMPRTACGGTGVRQQLPGAENILGRGDYLRGRRPPGRESCWENIIRKTSFRARAPPPPSMDDPDCDSTWEEDEEDAEDAEDEDCEDGEAAGARDADAGDEDEDEEPEEPRAARPSALQSRMTGSRNWRATRDMCRYRHNYPDLVERDCNGDTPNLSFYRNEIRFLPNGCFIEDILQNWRDNYDLLEDNHSYIQWLFPLREPGVNWHAKPLTLREVEVFKSSQEIQERLVRAYELMLGFYGIRLEDRGTGTVGRAQNYQKRFQNLNWRSHNNLRITRILKSLGELGLEHFQAPLVRFFLEETLVRQELPGVRQSALDYFMFAVRCRNQRRQLVHFAWEHFRPRCKFVWGPPDKLRRFKPSSWPRLLEGSRKAEEEGSPGDPDHKASTQGRTCGPEHSKGRGRVDEGPQPRSVEPQDAGPLERSQGDEAGGYGEDGPEPLSPKESKKRKLELSRREQPPTEPGPQSASEVEKIALNLEGCALSQGSLRTGTQEVGGQDPGEAVQPCPQPLGARVADKVRKRRRVDEGSGDSAVVASDGAQTLALAGCPAPSGYPKAGHSENGVEEDTEGRTGPKEGTPGSPSETPGPSPAGPAGDEPAESPSETPGPSPAGPAGDEPAKAGEAAEVQDTEAKPSAKSGKA
uniref:opioid growth factor receptor isoform X3 n=1 Tax=Macaca mulatta TaxID=9544 RepID=UPI0010A20417|nr:opioid growth factor receptor isoform X3 [Macaca mulatta]